MIVGLCHGCFDILHPGHVRHLAAAKAQVDWLIVGITSDGWVRVNKGPGHPYMKQEDRAAMLQALRWVDEVVIDDHPTPKQLLQERKPNIYFKGEDYAGPRGDVLDSQKALVESYGGKLVILGAKTHSSTALGEKLNAFRS